MQGYLDLIKEQREENDKLQSQLQEKEKIIEDAIEYIKRLSNEKNVFGHYGIDYNCKKYLLSILERK